MYDFRWIRWNIEKCQKHGVDPRDAEYVVNHARPPWPVQIGDGKWLVWGQTLHGTFLEVIYLYDDDFTVFVIHAMPMTEHQKRQYRRRRR